MLFSQSFYIHAILLTFVSELPQEPSPPPIEEDEAQMVSFTATNESVYTIRWQKYNGPVRYYKVVYNRRFGGGQRQQVLFLY